MLDRSSKIFSGARYYFALGAVFCEKFYPGAGLLTTSKTFSRRAERASNLTFSKCLHLVDLNNPLILMTHDKMAVTANIHS